jgi:hypothetical protein
MIRLIIAAGTLIWISGTPALAAPTNLPAPTRIAVWCATNGTLASPTNFFRANSNLVRAAVGSLGTDVGLSNHVAAVATAGSNYAVQVVADATGSLLRADGTVAASALWSGAPITAPGLLFMGADGTWLYGSLTMFGGGNINLAGGTISNGLYSGSAIGLYGINAGNIEYGEISADRLPAGVPTSHVFRTGIALGYGLTNHVLYVTVPTNSPPGGGSATNASLLRYGGTNLVGTVVVDTSGFGWNGTTLTARATGGGLNTAGTNYLRNFANQTNVWIGGGHLRAGAISNAALGATVAAGVTRGAAAVTNRQTGASISGSFYAEANATNRAYLAWWAVSNRFAVVQVIGAKTNVTFVSPK